MFFRKATDLFYSQQHVTAETLTKLANRCKFFPVFTLFRASILDFRPELGNRCKDFPVNTLFRASILDFKAKLGNRCSTIVMAVENGPPAE